MGFSFGNFPDVPHIYFYLLLSACITGFASAQRFDDIDYDVDFPGLTDGCTASMSTSVGCSGLLPRAAYDFISLALEQLNEIYTKNYLGALEGYIP